MLIRFTKAKNTDKKDVFACIRADGTTTWMETTRFFIDHDLTHYAVETTLGFTSAFYGLVASGWDIDSFEDREPGGRKARAVPAEASQAEALVGLIQLSRIQAETSFSVFTHQLRDVCAEMGVAVPQVTESQWREIDRLTAELACAYSAVAPGSYFEIDFPV